MSKMNIEWYPEEKRVSISTQQMKFGDVALLETWQEDKIVLFCSHYGFVSLSHPEYVFDKGFDAQVIPLEATLTVRKHKDFR